MGGWFLVTDMIEKVARALSKEQKEKLRAFKARQSLAQIIQQKRQVIMERQVQRGKCADCGIYPADPPSLLCPGCEAYREHQA